MAMPKYLDEHCDSIDAALFTGDTFHDEEAREELWAYIGRWTRALEATADERCEHGNSITGYCAPCGRIHSS